VNRVVVAQSILNALGGGTYLEIGVDNGSSFKPIKAQRKLGVDPSYTLSKRRLMKYAIFSFFGIETVKLFRMTSDDFFLKHQKMLTTCGIDVCLVDGLHTYDQSLRDVLNALGHLRPKGAILMHDCNPSTELMALPAASIDELITQGIPEWDGAWSGDVWKTIVHLRSLRNDINAFVLDCDTGIGVVTKGLLKATLAYSQEEVRGMDYNFLAAHRKDLLALQPKEYFQEFLRRHTSDQISLSP
jgi:hypothetical protein